MPQILDVKGAARANSYMLPPEALSPGLNSRKIPDTDVSDMVQDILDRGQLAPVLVQWNAANELEIVDGHRRVLAISQINKQKLAHWPELMKVRCERFSGKPEDSFAASVAANLKRKDLSPMDRAYDIQQFEKMNKSRKEIAQIMGISEPLISRSLKLTTLPAAIQRKVHKREIPAETAYELADMTPEDRAKVMEPKPAETNTAPAETNAESAETHPPADDTHITEAETPTAPVETYQKPATAQKLTRERIRQVKRDKAERGEETSGPVGRTKKEIRTQFEEWAKREDETIEEPIRKLCASVVKFIDGEIGERAILTRMRELAEGD
jgi:ParB/RepB/Spo0J family partition protein